MADFFKTTVGATISIDLGFDLAGYSSLVYVIKQPDGVVVNRTPTVDVESTGKTSLVTSAGDLDKIGIYTVQPKVTFLTPAAKTYFGTTVSFTVENILT